MSARQIIERERKAWSEQFAGGMLEFDSAYFDAIDRGEPQAIACGAGANALLDAFTAQLCKAIEADA